MCEPTPAPLGRPINGHLRLSPVAPKVAAHPSLVRDRAHKAPLAPVPALLRLMGSFQPLAMCGGSTRPHQRGAWPRGPRSPRTLTDPTVSDVDTRASVSVCAGQTLAPGEGRCNGVIRRLRSYSVVPARKVFEAAGAERLFLFAETPHMPSARRSCGPGLCTFPGAPQNMIVSVVACFTPSRLFPYILIPLGCFVTGTVRGGRRHLIHRIEDVGSLDVLRHIS